MLKQTGLAALVVWLFSLPALAQVPTLSLGGADLTLGMSKEAVLNKLKNGYALVKVEDFHPEDTWAIKSKEGHPAKGLGAISFVDGKLTAVQKQWGPFRGELGGAKLISTLSQILAAEQKKGHSTVTINTKQNTGRPLRSNLVDLILSDLYKEGDKPVRKVLQLFVVEDATLGASYGLIEILEHVGKQTPKRLEPMKLD